MGAKPYSEEMKAEMVERYKNGETVRAIAKYFGIQATPVSRVLKSRGIKIIKRVGKLHPMWKGGRIQKGDGYIGIWIPEHERADNQGYVYEHTLVMESKIGRLPEKGEVVHHINLDKQDNRPENLHLCGHAEHTTLHRDLDRLVKPLLELGILFFNEQNGRYEIGKRLKEV